MICLQTPSFGWSFQDGRQLASKPVHHNNELLDPVLFLRSVIKGHTYTWRQIMPQKSFNKPFEILWYIDLHFFSVCVYCNRSQETSQCVKNNMQSRHSTLSRVFLFFTRCVVICDLLQYTRTEKCCLFVKFIIHLFYNRINKTKK